MRKNENITFVKNDSSFEYNFGKSDNFYIIDAFDNNCVDAGIDEVEEDKNSLKIFISGKSFIFNTKTNEIIMKQ